MNSPALPVTWFCFASIAIAQTSGTQILDIHPGGASSFPQELVRVGDRVFFLADDGVNGFELHVTDGTAQGTHLVEALSPTNGPPTFLSARPFLSKLFFFGPSPSLFFAPWISDGTAAGTFELGSVSILGEAAVTIQRDRLFFRGFDFSAGENGAERIFISDGTVAGTRPFGSFSLEAGLGCLTTFGDRLVFGDLDPTLGLVLRSSDGTVAGTSVVKDLSVGVEGQLRSELVVADSRLFFVVEDSTLGTQLWTSDGTTQGTNPLIGVLPTTQFGSTPLRMLPFGDDLLFTNYGPALEEQLWVTDGTVLGTVKLFSITNGVKFLDIDYTQSKLGVVFSTLGPPTPQAPLGEVKLWRTDGTTTGTVEVPIAGSCVPGARPGRVGSDGILALPIASNTAGVELHRVDGGVLAPTLAFDLIPGGVGSNPGQPVRLGNRVLFAADDGVNGVELHAIPLTAFATYAAEAVGFGCAPGSAPRPTLGLDGAALAGTTPTLSAEDLPAASVALLVASSGLDFTPIGTRCLLYPSPLDPGFITLPLVTDAQGRVRLPVPVAASWIGVTATAQILASSGTPVPFATNGLELVFGG